MIVLDRILRLPHRLGWVPGEADETYHAAPGLNSSSLKALVSGAPAHFLAALAEVHEPSPAMEFGTKVHRHLLHGHDLLVRPELNARTKDGKAQRAALEAEARAANEILVTEEEAKILARMYEAFARHRQLRFMERVDPTKLEVSGYAEAPEFSVKMRADILHDGIIWDLKTAQSASPERFPRDAWNFGYHVQAAWYLAVAGMIEPGSYRGFRFITLEKEPPFSVVVYEPDAALLEHASSLIASALQRLKCALDEGLWPSYPDDTVPLSLPKWVAKQNEGF